MIHILQSVSNMDRGGIESMLMNYYWHLDRTRFQFDFLVNKKKPGFFDDEIRALGGRIFQSPGVAPQSYPAYLRSMQQLLAQVSALNTLTPLENPGDITAYDLDGPDRTLEVKNDDGTGLSLQIGAAAEGGGYFMCRDEDTT